MKINPDNLRALLLDRTRLGKRVLLLLAVLAERGLTSVAVLQKILPRGVHGEVSAAYRADYIARTPHGLDLLPKGREVVWWLAGKSAEPRHWTVWEDSVRAKENITLGERKGR